MDTQQETHREAVPVAECRNGDECRMAECYNGEEQPLAECVTLTYGEHEGAMAHRDDEDLVMLAGGDYCLATDDYHQVGMDYYHDDQLEGHGISWDHHNDCYDFEADMDYGYINRNDHGFFSQNNSVCHDGNYYMDDAVISRHGFSWDEHRERYVHEDDEDEPDADDYDQDGDGCQDDCAGYHTQTRGWRTTRDTLWRFGVEAEKEDVKVRESCMAGDLHESTGWCKEEDGSLNSNSGFELVSPVYDLFTNDIFDDIAGDRDLERHIGAAISKRCGGHFNLSHRDHSPSDLFEMLSGWFPLLFMLYTKRLELSYSCGKSKKALRDDREKHQCIAIHGGRLEFRLFSAIRDAEHLRWRVELMRRVCSTPTANAWDVVCLLKKSRPLRAHMLRVITRERLDLVISGMEATSALYGFDYVRPAPTKPEIARAKRAARAKSAKSVTQMEVFPGTPPPAGMPPARFEGILPVGVLPGCGTITATVFPDIFTTATVLPDTLIVNPATGGSVIWPWMLVQAAAENEADARFQRAREEAREAAAIAELVVEPF